VSKFNHGSTKRRPQAPFGGKHRQESGSGQRLDLRGQAALGAGGLVLVDDLLVRDAVEDRDGRLIDALGDGFVAGFDRLAHALDRGAQEVPESVAFYFSQ